MRITICGKRWNLRRVPYLGDARGDCSSPNVKGKEIRVLSGLKDEEELEVLIHEMLHASNWSLDETHVSTVAEDIASALWKLGYRKAE